MMKRIIIAIAVSILTCFLSGCFAFLPQSDGYLSIDLEIPPEAKGPGEHPVVIFVANADMEDSIKELLWLIDKETDEIGGLNDKEEDRLEDLAVAVSNRGLVKFGGDPFLRTTIPATTTSGSFKIPAVPAGRSYFVKVFVFEVGQDIVNVDELSDVTVVVENQLFDTENYTAGSDWTDWTRYAPAPFPIKVEAGETTEIDITLVPEL
jgi:hypothetical protein